MATVRTDNRHGHSNGTITGDEERGYGSVGRTDPASEVEIDLESGLGETGTKSESSGGHQDASCSEIAFGEPRNEKPSPRGEE